MKKDIRLQEYANKSMEQYNSPEILESLKQHIKPKEKKEPWYDKVPRKTWYAIGGSFATVAVVVVVLLCVFLIEPGILSPSDTDTEPGITGNPSTTPPRKEYLGDTISVNSQISEVNQHTINIDFSDENIVFVKKHSDSYYGDVLYFSVNYYDDKTLDLFFINVVTNEDYNYVHYDSTGWVKTEYREYELVYNEASEEDDGVYFFKIDAILRTGEEDIAICYEGVGLEETSNFLSILDQIFIQ